MIAEYEMGDLNFAAAVAWSKLPRNQIRNPQSDPTPLKLLDRYIFRNFIEPFLMCFLGFIAIWLVFDLMGNLQDFLQADVSLKQVAKFYATQVPDIVVLSLPVGLLLAVLFSLSRMSRTNEIISMLTAGRSVMRLIVPLVGVGLLASGVSLALNYEVAPHAASIKKSALEQMTKSGKKLAERGIIEGYLFRDRMNDRTWFVRRMRPNSAELSGLHITQHDAQGNITRKWYAKGATYKAADKTWVLNRGLRVDFNAEGERTAIDDFALESRTITGWSETPWRILSAHLEAQNLSIPELRDYLRFNSDFPAEQLAPYETFKFQRWALPFQCLVVILLAAPLAIVYSRRGIVGGVAGAMALYAGLMLSSYLFLALGKGGRIPPMVAAWFPNAFFALIGLYMLYLRASNRELPRFGFGRK